MSDFNGFPVRMEFTPVPNVFLSTLLPEISDLVELKLTLHLFRLLYYKKGSPQFVSFNELANDAGLMSSIKENDINPEETLHRGWN